MSPDTGSVASNRSHRSSTSHTSHRSSSSSKKSHSSQRSSKSHSSRSQRSYASAPASTYSNGPHGRSFPDLGTIDETSRSSRSVGSHRPKHFIQSDSSLSRGMENLSSNKRSNFSSAASHLSSGFHTVASTKSHGTSFTCTSARGKDTASLCKDADSHFHSGNYILSVLIYTQVLGMYEGEAGNPVEGGTEERVERRIGEAYVARAGGMWALAEEKEVFGCFGGVVEPKGTSGGSVRSVTSDTSSGGGIYGAIMRDARLALECERISACKRTLTGGDEASGAVVRSKALCLLGYALLRRGIIEGISDAFEGCLDVAKTALKSADKKNSDELNKTINKAKDGLADLGRYEMLSTRLKKENRSRANIYLHDLSDVLKLSPASDKWNMEMIRFLSYQRRWYAVANYCERMAAKVLEVEGAFEGDLAEFHSTPGVTAEDLTVEFFEKKEEVPSYLRVVGDKAAGDVALRLPECLTPIYLRALRLEERFGAASCATSALIDVGGWRFDCANREMPILQKTVQLKEEADVLFRDGVFERAAGLYERCIMADNDSKESPGGKLHAVLHSNRASCFSSLGQHAEAIAECKAATDIHSMYMAAILRMARCYAKAGDTEKAKEVYSKWNMLVEKARRQPYPPVNAGPACFFDMPSEVKSHEWNAVKDEMKELGLTVISSSKRGLGGYSGRSGSFLSRITLKRSNRGQRSRSKGPVSRGFSLFKSGCCKKAESQVVRDQPVSKYSSSSNGGSARAFERHDSASSHSRKPSRRRTYSRSPSPPSPKSASSRDATRHDEPSIAWSNASSDANSIDAIRRDNAKRPNDPSTSRDANRHLDPSELDGSNARPDPPLSNPNMLRPKQNGFQNPLEPPIQIDTNVDYYDTLDLDKHASSSDIKKAYRRLAKQYHPDKNTGSHELFQEIQHAYNILGDEANKAKYDRKRMIIDP